MRSQKTFRCILARHWEAAEQLQSQYIKILENKGEKLDGHQEMIEKCKPFAPVVSAAVVAACVAGSLYGYEAPVYEMKASVEDTQEQEDEVPVVKTSTEKKQKRMKRQKKRNRQRVPLIWKMVSIREPEPDIGVISR